MQSKKSSLFVFGVILAFFSTVITGCQTDTNSPKIDFYHWKTHFKWETEEQLIMQEFTSKRLYLRFFDVSYVPSQREALPKATIQFPSGSDLSSIEEIVPVVYITNDVFRETHEKNIRNVSRQVFEKIVRIWDKNIPKTIAIPEIQIDCDWTVKTRSNYFLFLQYLEESIQKHWQIQDKESQPLLTSTLRLHQLKYPEQTGVPPVAKAVLMLYNMGDLTQPEETNSILHLGKTESYLGRLSRYPLPLTLAYPFYEWGVLYRDGKLSGIINTLDQDSLLTAFEPSEDQDNMFKAIKDTYVGRTFIMEGDLLRIESVTPSDLKALKRMIHKYSAHSYDVILYHIHSTLLKKYDHEVLHEIFL